MVLSGKQGIVNTGRATEDDYASLLRVRGELADLVDEMLQARDKFAKSVIELYRSLATYSDESFEEELNNLTFLKLSCIGSETEIR